ncbi:MAG TPA: glycosyltransferase family 87 protein [Terracidiphilus sp.]|nr:glycosyltransferase family 87 protein [Terracidiphilus sp.]
MPAAAGQTPHNLPGDVKRNPWRVAAAVCIVCLGLGFVVALYAIGLTDKSAGARDYIEYWAAGQVLVRGGNPFDPETVFQLERANGWDKDFPQVSLSPPIILLLAWPLGHTTPKTGLILWLLASLGCIAASVGIAWRLYGNSQSSLHLVAFAFPPALGCMMAGQLGNFFLLEVALFLYLHRSRPWLAGAALVLFALKPHLFVPCFFVLLLWSAARKDFRVLAGFLASLAACCGIVTLLDPQAWRQYQQMLHSTRITDAFIPTAAVAFRFLVHRQARWLEFLPEAGACLWAVWFFLSRRARWNWLDEGLLLLLVSLACAPYGWYYDQALLFPAILAGLYRAEHSRISLLLFVLIAAAGLAGVFGHIQPTSVYYVWTASAWLLWYIFATWVSRSSAVTSEISAAAV